MPSLMAKYDTLSATRDDAYAWTAKAKAAMEHLPEHDIRDLLIGIADYVVERLN